MAETPATSPARGRLAPLALSGLLAVLASGWGFHAWLEAHHERPGTALQSAAKPVPERPRSADFGSAIARADVHRVADWAVASADHGHQPFAVVDKVQARLYVFAPTGRLIGASPILLGLTRGDDSAPGVGDKPVAAVRPEERTTPAGRFAVEPGENLGGEHVIWVDYDAAVSMHSVRANVKSERRLERLQSADPAEHRISYGCINVPAAFFASVAWPSFAKGGVVYVLPETRPLADVFPALRDAPVATTASLGSAQAPDFLRDAPR
ncbi:MAG TPA: hypothetical protein VLD35_13835 [Caldimonas sp.]|nr:hypothetical protein [Caldimonas sp.]